MTPRGGSAWGWAAALAATLSLHAGALLALRPGASPAPPSDRPPAWRVSMRAAAPQAPLPVPPPAQAPAAEPPAPVPAPEPPVRAPTPEPVAPPPAAPAPESPPAPAPAPEPAPAEAPAPRAAPASERPTLSDSGWLDATQVDQAPVPVYNEWVLTDMPWPRPHHSVMVRLWIGADGRIERYELEGDAADDPALQTLFAPIAKTPMRPARIGDKAVPSTMRIELWSGDGDAPDFVAPLPPPNQ